MKQSVTEDNKHTGEKQSIIVENEHDDEKYKTKKSEKVLMEVCLIFIYIIFVVVFSFLIEDAHRKTYFFYYFIISLAVLFAAIASIMKGKKYFDLFFTLSFATLLFVLAYRNVSAIDDPAYSRIFKEVARDGWITRFIGTTMEPGYLLLNQIVCTFTDNYLYLQVISTFIPLTLIYYTFYKLKDKISLPLAVFLFVSMFYFQVLSTGLVRHFIALSIVFYAFTYIPKKDIKKYIALIFLASTFHYSSLFMLILVFFTFKRITISKKAKLFIGITAISIPLAFFVIYKFLIPVLGARYQQYAMLKKFNISISDFDTFPLLILVLMFRKKIKKENYQSFMLMVTIYSLSILVSIYASVISLGRLIFYTNSAFYVLASMVKKELDANYKTLIYTTIIIFYGVLYLYWTQFHLVSHFETLFPYQNIFFEF